MEYNSNDTNIKDSIKYLSVYIISSIILIFNITFYFFPIGEPVDQLKMNILRIIWVSSGLYLILKTKNLTWSERFFTIGFGPVFLLAMILIFIYNCYRRKDDKN